MIPAQPIIKSFVKSAVKTLSSIALCLSFIVLSSSAQTEQETRIQLDIINRQLSELHQTNARSPQAKNIHKELITASKDYDKAVKSISSIKEIEIEIENLHKQMVDLQKRKIQLIKDNDASLQSIKNRIDENSIDLRQVITGGEQVKSLQAEQLRLIQQIEENDKKTESTTNEH